MRTRPIHFLASPPPHVISSRTGVPTGVVGASAKDSPGATSAGELKGAAIGGRFWASAPVASPLASAIHARSVARARTSANDVGLPCPDILCPIVFAKEHGAAAPNFW